MKTKPLFKALILCVLFQVTSGSFIHAQFSADSSKFRIDQYQYYTNKSKQQKKLATGALVSGSVLALVGGYVWFLAPIAGLSETGDVDGATRTGRALTLTGTGLIAVSIPLFVASKNSKQKAKVYLDTRKLSFSNSYTIGMSARISLD